MLVDFHAEATSEKVAMGWHLDGRVTACVGTHTHVPTADARVLPGRHRLRDRRGHDGPARRRDRRTSASRRSQRFLTMVPTQFQTSDEDPWLNAVLVEAGDDGRATSRRADPEARGVSFEAYEIDLHGHSMVYRRAARARPWC